MATEYDSLLDSEPELARTMAASVKQRIAFGESLLVDSSSLYLCSPITLPVSPLPPASLPGAIYV